MRSVIVSALNGRAARQNNLPTFSLPRLDGIVPVAVECIRCHVHCGKLLVGHLDADRVAALVEFRFDGQSLFGDYVPLRSRVAIMPASSPPADPPHAPAPASSPVAFPAARYAHSYSMIVTLSITLITVTYMLFRLMPIAFVRSANEAPSKPFSAKTRVAAMSASSEESSRGRPGGFFDIVHDGFNFLTKRYDILLTCGFRPRTIRTVRFKNPHRRGWPC